MKKMIVCILGMVLMACTSSKNVEVTVLDETNMEDKTQEDFDLSACVKDWDFAVLEQNDSCLLSGIRQIKIVGEDVFVVNIEGLQSDIYRFTTDGKLQNRLGRQGSGYDFVINVMIDSTNRKVCLLDIFEHSIHQYGYKGNYLRSYKPYPQLHYIADAFYLADNEILGYYGITRDYKMAYFMADSLLLLKDTLSFYQVSSDNPGVFNFSSNAVSHYNSRTLLIHPFCDTIYEYRDHCLRPVFVTKIGASLPENYRFEHFPNCLKVKEQLEKQGYCSKTGIFETESHIWIGCGRNRLMYDKRKNEGVYFKDSMHYHSDIYPPIDFIGRKGEYLVTLVSGEEILEAREAMMEQKMMPEGRLKELFERIEGKERVLFFYSFH